MHRETFGEASDPDLVCVMGWGNRLDHENVRWLLDHLAEEYRVHAFQIPTSITSFEDEWLAPVADVTADLGDYRFVGHSTGGLIGAYLIDRFPPVTATFLSPFWGFSEGPQLPLVKLLSRLPYSGEVLPTGTGGPEFIGELMTERQEREGPDGASPTFLRESLRGHRGLPAFDDDHVVFCTLRDRVVSTRAIGDRVSAENVVVYDGGHELFSSRCRDDRIDEVLAAVDEGVDAVA